MFSHILEYKCDGRFESERKRENCILTRDKSKSARVVTGQVSGY